MKLKGFICTGLSATGILLAACGPARTSSSATHLIVEEHRLVGAPSTEPLEFRPVEGSMAGILSLHAVERSRIIPDHSEFLQGRHAIRITVGSELLTATENYSASGNRGWVTVTRGETEIYRMETGMPSPIPGLQGFWTYDGHWILETVYITPDTFGGRLSRDGALLCPLADDDELFDFQLMAGRPFFFLRVDGNIRLSYDEQELAAGYNEIPHYQCCSASALNPLHAENMVAFFARRGDNWYYVEAGLLGD